MQLESGGIVKPESSPACRQFEHLRLTAEDANLVYTAIPSGQKEASFKSTAATDTLLVFENLEHDFPKRILYRRRGADSIVARIEGGNRGIDFPMRRVSCA
jgi:hypothetical protein